MLTITVLNIKIVTLNVKDHQEVQKAMKHIQIANI